MATSPRSVLSRVPGVKQITEGRSFGARTGVRSEQAMIVCSRCGAGMPSGNSSTGGAPSSTAMGTTV
jgi:hypothetical protein